MKKQRGFSLLEVLIVIGALLALSAAVVWAAVSARRESAVEGFVTQYQTMAHNIRTRYRTPDGYTGLTFAQARADGQIPDGFLSDSLTVGRTPWGTTLDVGPAQAETDVRAANQSFVTTLIIPDAAVCNGVLLALAGRVQRIRMGPSVYVTAEPFQAITPTSTQWSTIRTYCSEDQKPATGSTFYLYDQ